ncbi:hypothetical protein PAS25_02690 [Leclercia adecarboxylata]|uniref:hypothetical protein n=1 Tax=Enterobacteriaceae TaxID=543 RepID=UPI002570BF98|nr:hypothetical protein [Enterobacter sp. MF024]
MVKTVNPKASETPTKPIPSSGNPAASTALPHPPNTNQNVPKHSAANFLNITTSKKNERNPAPLLFIAKISDDF